MRRFMFAVSIAFLTLFGFMTSTLWGELTKENVLIKKVITREYSVLVGTTGPNEIKEMVSLEVSLFIGEDASPHNQIISRETIVVVASDAPPTPITTELSVTVSPTGETVILDWSDYKQWAEKDIDHFDIYYTAKGPFDTVPAQGLNVNSVRTESTSKTIEFLPAFTDHYFAVVPVDALGYYYTQVSYSASYVLSPEVISREASLFIGEDASPYNQIISREISILTPDSKIPEQIPVTGHDDGFYVVTSPNKYSAV